MESTAECAEFLSKEERSFVATIRERYGEELAAREAEGKAFPFFYGSVALARIFQASENDTEKAAEWFQNLQKTLADPEVEALVQDVLQRFQTNNSAVSASMLPHHDSVKDFYNVELCAPKLSPDGDIIVYLPLVDLDRNGILEHMDWDHWVTFSRASTVLHCIALDKISRESQRMARLILIVDMEGLPLEGVVHRTFARAHRRDVIDSFQQKVAAEIVASVYVVNVPWTLANLFTLCKTFIPAKFLQKCRVLSNANDKDLVKHCGGQDQLTELLKTRKGLVSNSSAHDGQQLFLLDAWPDEEELQMISRLREKFAEELLEREKGGTLWPCFFSDLALGRVLRGNERYFSEASNWFQAFLKKMEKHQVDEIAKKMSSQLENMERASLSMLPHAEEVGKYFRCTFSAPRLTPKGDVIWFIPLGDFDRQAIVDHVNWEHFVEFVRAMVVLRALEAQRLSETQQRMVKCIAVVDLLNSGVGTTGAPRVEEFDEPNQKNIAFMRQIIIDILGPVYVLNAPWVAVKAFNWFKSLVPERFSRKLVLLDGDGLSDPDFLELVGEAQLKHLLATRVGLLSGEVDQDEGDVTVAAGDSMTKCRDLKRGERISWSSSIEAGDGDSWFGVSDIVTLASVMFHPELNSQEDEDEVTLDAVTISASDGEVTRNYTADRDCVITLCWSNEHSRMRAKGLRFHIRVAQDSQQSQQSQQSVKAAEGLRQETL